METATYQLSAGDYAAYLQRRSARQTGWVLAVGIATIGFLSIIGDGGRDLPTTLGAMIVGFALLALYILVFVPRHARGIFSDQPSLSEAKTLSIDENGGEFRQASGSFRFEWKAIVKWDETARLLVLYVNRAMLIAIPKSDIGEEMATRIKGLLIQSGLSEPMRRRPAR